MKLFSLVWKSSKRPSKQRKYRYNSPLHLKRGFLAAHLAPNLSAKYSTASINVREGDTVKVMRGEFSGLAGKINSVSTKKGLVYVDGAERIRKDGTKSYMPLRPSNLLVVEATIEDKRRIESLTRKSDANRGKSTANAKITGKSKSN
ncbi:50S ribosomal protein L24 [Candidatus Woesearchaeota archaeon]|nr:50S ribosomal protein L24 [Candidatus Woesearchaeota archaeon]